jgi:SAM-dependent methyltransferase
MSRDPRDPDFWNQRFEQGIMPWDKGAVPQALIDYTKKNASPENCLIPGCGIGNEIAFLVALGWHVAAIDFSSAAVALAKEKLGEFAGHVEQADFFHYVPSAPLSIIYERAFFCALPPALRGAIVDKWASLLATGACLIGFFFIDDSEEASIKGPPFSIKSEALSELMGPYFLKLDDREVLDSLPVFEGKERWQVWCRR